jgi:hypothetical protein
MSAGPDNQSSIQKSAPPMTEDEWLASTDAKALLAFVKGKISERKLRLFTCACGRRKLERLYSRSDPRFVAVMARYDDRDRRILDVEERYADGAVSMEALVAVYEEAGNDPTDALDAAYFDPYLDAYYVDADFVDHCGTTPAEVQSVQCKLLHDIIGNPFQPTLVDPSWGKCTDVPVLKMAQAIYDRRSFGDLWVLAIVLEEAGCTNAQVLHHCREPGPHVRGCWVVDLVLGKS